jgi:hypothetical protein
MQESIIFCPEMQLDDIEEGYKFPSTRELEVAHMPCPLNWTGVANWVCVEGGHWASKYPDFS